MGDNCCFNVVLVCLGTSVRVPIFRQTFVVDPLLKNKCEYLNLRKSLNKTLAHYFQNNDNFFWQKHHIRVLVCQLKCRNTKTKLVFKRLFKSFLKNSTMPFI